MVAAVKAPGVEREVGGTRFLLPLYYVNPLSEGKKSLESLKKTKKFIMKTGNALNAAK